MNEAEMLLKNLLAIIHRDGGHYTQQHGIRTSVDDAITDVVGLRVKVEALEFAIIKTLNENGHLADGENCTLIDLKLAMPTWELE